MFSRAPSSAQLQPGGGLQLGWLLQVCQAGQMGRYKERHIRCRSYGACDFIGLLFYRYAAPTALDGRFEFYFLTTKHTNYMKNFSRGN